MKKKLVARSDAFDSITQKVIRLCFDPKSIDRYSPGLKLVYATDDPPLFVMLEEVEPDHAPAVFR
jgi:hypothetical protein